MSSQSTGSTASSTTSSCPKCGCPARFVRVRAVVRCALSRDGLVLKDLSNMSIAALEEGVQTLECGGGHTWTIETPHVVL